MKFANHLTKADIQKFNQIKRAARDKEENNRKKKVEESRPVFDEMNEHFSKSKKKEEKVDWEEIMGTNRETFKRVRGSIRRR